MQERVWVDTDEAYPVFYPFLEESSWRHEVLVPGGFMKRYEAAQAEWRACQEILSDASDKARIARGHLREDEKLMVAKAEKTDAEIDQWIADHPQPGRDPAERRASLIDQRDYARSEADRLGLPV